MDAYPEDYIVHNLPLLLLSGLTEDGNDVHVKDGHRSILHEGGFRLRIDLPPLNGHTARQLEQLLLNHDSSNIPWSAKSVSQQDKKTCFRVKSIGRIFTLPPRKAPPPPHSPRLNATGGNAVPPPAMVLHSVLSPLSPRSPLYADGIMTPLWVAKHQFRLPSSLVVFFGLSSDINTSTLVDNKIKSEISNIRSVFTSANYKTRTLFVLVGEASLEASEVEDRMTNIRRAAALDNKSIFFFPHEASSAELSNFVSTLLQNLQSANVEYYRDLSKHARRKRSRNVVPPPTVPPNAGATQPLSQQAWIVRYEFKLGVFAEFRQEMDAALRNYETAYDNLLSAEVIEHIPSWSPRFNEARLLADTITIRIIRCLLWNGQTTGAVKRWSSHRTRISDMITRQGLDIKTYGWECWQNIWTKVMADLIHRAQIHPIPRPDQVESVEKSILVHSEKTLPSTDRFSPWESLHHEGYWLNLAQRHTRARRVQAQLMPEEDRKSPGESPASAIASKAQLYDRYLTLEPHKELPLNGSRGFDYTKDIVGTIDAAIHHFLNHGQLRMIQVLKLKKAAELMQSSDWQTAILILRPLWQDPLLRKEGWWPILAEVSRALRKCAIEVRDTKLLGEMVWELEHPMLGGVGTEDMSNELLPAIQANVEVRDSLEIQDRLSSISAYIAFASAEGHIGKAITLQISLHLLATSRANPVSLHRVLIAFDGGLPSVCLANNEEVRTEADKPKPFISDVEFAEVLQTGDSLNHGDETLFATANLSLLPGGTKVYQTKITPRQDGAFQATSITLEVDVPNKIALRMPREKFASQSWWELRQGKAVSRLHGKGRDVATIRVLPRPPKLEIEMPQLRNAYYTNEEIELVIDYCNYEDEVLNGSIEAKMLSPNQDKVNIKWKGQEVPAEMSTQSTESALVLPQQHLKNLEAGNKFTNSIVISSTNDTVDHEVEITVTYTLPSSPQTVLRKQITVDLAVVRPFEATFGFHSRYHNSDWPSFFSIKNISQDKTEATGLKQQFSVSALICSFAVEDLTIKTVRLSPHKMIGEAICTISDGSLVETTEGGVVNGINIQPEQDVNLTFDMIIHKKSLGNRQPVAVDCLLEIAWMRTGSPNKVIQTSTIPVPRFLAPSSEPRVLLRIQPALDPNISDTSVHHLTYSIENPSLHFLTFNITMETSEEFAFSGPKATSVSLVPISRHDIHYQIIPTAASHTNNNNNLGPERSRTRPGITSGGGSGGAHDAGTSGTTPTTVVAGRWVRVQLDVVDAYFGQTLRPQPASDGVRVDKQGNVLVRIG